MALGAAKPTLISIVAYIVVIVAGAVILMFMEREGLRKTKNDEEQRPGNRSLIQANNVTQYTKQYLENHSSNKWSISDVAKLLKDIKGFESKNKKSTPKDDAENENEWRKEISLKTFAKWEYFVVCTLSTIGYGDITPITSGARILTVLVQVIGIPITLYMFLSIAACFTKCISCCKNSIASRCQRRRPSKPDMICFFFSIILALLYVGAGGIALGLSQGWKWHDGLYWSFTVATTVGYGDLIPKSKATLAFAFFGIIFMLMPVYALSQALQEDEEVCKEDRLMPKAEEI